MNFNLWLEQEELNQIAQSVTRKLKCDMAGSCEAAAELIARAFLKNNFKEFKIVSGRVKTPKPVQLYKNREYENHKISDYWNHVWIELNNGKIIDPTFTQFPPGTDYVDPGPTAKYNPEYYLSFPGVSKRNAYKPYINN